MAGAWLDFSDTGYLDVTMQRSLSSQPAGQEDSKREARKRRPVWPPSSCLSDPCLAKRAEESSAGQQGRVRSQPPRSGPAPGSALASGWEMLAAETLAVSKPPGPRPRVGRQTERVFPVLSLRSQPPPHPPACLGSAARGSAKGTEAHMVLQEGPLSPECWLPSCVHQGWGTSQRCPMLSVHPGQGCARPPRQAQLVAPAQEHGVWILSTPAGSNAPPVPGQHPPATALQGKSCAHLADGETEAW